MVVRGGNGYTWRRQAPGQTLLQSTAEFMQFRTRASTQMSHNFWVLDFNFTPGERVRIRSANSPWGERPANVAHLYAPGCPFWEDVGPNGRPVYVHCAYVMFAESDLLHLDELLPTPVQHARFFDEQRIVGSLLSEIVSVAVTEGDAGYWRAHALLFDILARLHEASALGKGAYRIHDSLPATEPAGFVMQVLAHFRAHLAEPITIADLAREIGMSPSALAHRYRSETGETPMTTLRRERINLAKGLLAKGFRLTDIAGQVGFTDAFHLSKAFKQLEGLSPREYRSIASSKTPAAY